MPSPRWWRLALAVLALCAVAGGVALIVRPVGQDDSGPAGVVRHYFAALQRGDAATALSYGPLPRGSRALLGAAALRDQLRMAPIGQVTVVSSTVRGDAASVQVGYELGFRHGGTDVAADLGLRRIGDRWQLRAAAVATRFAFTAAAQRASIDGVRVPAGAALTFPGAVDVRFDSSYLVGTVGNGSVTFGAPATTGVQVEVTAAGRAAMRRATLAALRSCLRGGTDTTTCPQPDERYVPGSVRGVLSAAPTLRVGLARSALGVLTARGAAVADVRYRRLDFTNRPRAGHGTVRLDVHAEAVATRGLAAGDVRWAG